MSFSFHTRSLPTARLIWHCPYIVLFRSADGTVNGPDYREYAVVRLNGEDWDPDGEATNRTTVHRDTDFRGWNAWKQSNKEGYDCKVAFARNGGQITVSTKNLGLDVKNVTTRYGLRGADRRSVRPDQYPDQHGSERLNALTNKVWKGTMTVRAEVFFEDERRRNDGQYRNRRSQLGRRRKRQDG